MTIANEIGQPNSQPDECIRFNVLNQGIFRRCAILRG
jgi:hypothetical protein